MVLYGIIDQVVVVVIIYVHLVLYRMGIFSPAHGWGGGLPLPLSKICHMYCTMIKLSYTLPEEDHSYTLPKEDPKHI